MPKHAGYHTRDTSNALKEDEPRYPLLLGHGVSPGQAGCARAIASDQIHAPAEEADCAEGELIGEAICIFVGDSYGEDLFLSVSVYGESSVGLN